MALAGYTTVLSAHNHCHMSTPPVRAAAASWTVVRGVLQGGVSESSGVVPYRPLSKHEPCVGAHTGAHV